MLYDMVHWDSETHTILPGRPAPPPVCVQYLGVKDGQPTASQIITGDDMLDWFAWAISSGSILCGLNQSYDLLVMIEYAIRRGVPKLDVWRKVFEHLAAGLSRCTEIRERLLRIARGMPDVAGLSMEDQAKTYLGLDLSTGIKGVDSWRLRYGELERWPTETTLNDPNAPLADILTLEQALALRAGMLVYGAPRPPATWPKKALDYALQDPVIEQRTGPAFSPDGSRHALVMSFIGNPEIFVSDLNSNTAACISDSIGAAGSPSWPPDGKRIAFSNDDGHSSIYVVEVREKEGQSTRLFHWRTGYSSSTDPEWSPDGRQIAFTARSGDQWVVAIKSYPGGSSRVIQRGGAMHPSWSPNSRYLCYTQHGELFVHEIATGGRRSVLKNFGRITEPRWMR